MEQINQLKIYKRCNPDELSTPVGGLRKLYPDFNIVGGCCGTDLRHMDSGFGKFTLFL